MDDSVPYPDGDIMGHDVSDLLRDDSLEDLVPEGWPGIQPDGDQGFTASELDLLAEGRFPLSSSPPGSHFQQNSSPADRASGPGQAPCSLQVSLHKHINLP